MIAGIKKCIDDGDIKGLRYIFLDSLDVDPTFENYKEDYDVCRKLDGMFEPYIELNDLSTDKSIWDMNYWGKLKFDQKKNFSEKRFEHMMEVAKIVHADKIERLLAERATKKNRIEEQIEQVIPQASETPIQQSIQSPPVQQSLSQQPVHQPIQQSVQTRVVQNEINKGNGCEQGNIADSEKARIDEGKRAIELHNRKVTQEIHEKQRKREAAAKEIERQNALLEAQNESKKAPGIVAVILIVVVVVLLLKVL